MPQFIIRREEYGLDIYEKSDPLISDDYQENESKTETLEIITVTQFMPKVQSGSDISE
jgi:hypothetical protein